MLPIVQFVLISGGRAQSWRISTPRDTVYVPANQSTLVTSHLSFGSSVQADVHINGTFGAFPGQNGSGLDARYTYSVPNWNAPFPLPNPPRYNGTGYQIYLAIKTNPLNEGPINVLENSYQQSHQYTARYLGMDGNFQFRIIDRLNERPDGYYYSQASGGLTINLAQYTAGVALQYSDLEFGATNVGTQSYHIDSIASYGVDPLQVDSVVIEGPNASDFSVISEHGSSFTLANEATNYFRVIYSPLLVAQSQAYLYIYSHNAYGPDRIKTVTLNGFGALPKESVSPDSIDFGLTHIGYPAAHDIVITNSGNASLYIDSVWLVNDPGTPSGIFSAAINLLNITRANPRKVWPSSQSTLAVLFNPYVRSCYGARMYFLADDGRRDSVRLTGCGAESVFTIDNPSLNFGIVRSRDRVVRYDTVRNTGNWTAHVVRAKIEGANAGVFTMQPSDSAFLLDPGAVRIYTIAFQPSTMTDASLTADLRFYFDNASQPQSISLVGYERKPRIAYDTNVVNFGRIKVGDSKHRSLGVVSSTSIPSTFTDTVISANQSPSAFRLTAPAPAILPPGHDSLDLLFQPLVHGPADGWLYMNVNGEQDSIYLFGFGAQPMSVFSPPVLDYGVVPAGSVSYQSTTVKDTGDYPLYICQVAITGPDSADFTLAHWQTPDTIRDDGIDSRSIGVNFTTTAHIGRTHYATLRIIYCDGSMDTVSLIAKESEQYVQFSTNRIDFGKVHAGSRLNKPATFMNGASIALKVGTIWTTPSRGPFSSAQATTDVGAGSTTDVPISFAPISRGNFTGYLHAGGGDMKEDSIPLSGVGAAAVPMFSDSLIDFGTILINTSSADSLLTLTNAGDWPVTAKIVKFGDRYNEFTIITGQGDTVRSVAYDSAADGSKRSYLIHFKPSHPELPYHEADLEYLFDDGTIQIVRLIGRDRSDFLVADTNAINFGKIRIGKRDSRYLHFINTSLGSLTIDPLQIISDTQFTATPSGSVSVAPRTDSAIAITFIPKVIGEARALLVGQGSAFLNGIADTIVLQGIGAGPVPVLSTTSIDYGTRTAGTSWEQNFTLSNGGNWPLIISWSIAGPNAADFTPHIPLDTSIDENGTANYSVTFLATTPWQTTPRTATITFTEDDGTTFSVNLIAHDKPPLPAAIGFGNYTGRPGDSIYAYLKLQSDIPAKFGIQHVQGSVNYDPSVINLVAIAPGIQVLGPQWTTAISNRYTGSFDYDISSTSDTLVHSGNLLMLIFHVREDAKAGDLSPLRAVSAFPESREATAVSDSGVVMVDNACGDTHIITGIATATFIGQNNPNPFGSDMPTTTLPFDVGNDNTIITIRVLNSIGKEVFRPIDHQTFARGRYTISIRAKDVGTGAFFYEFIPSGQQPQMKKMIVQ